MALLSSVAPARPAALPDSDCLMASRRRGRPPPTARSMAPSVPVAALSQVKVDEGDVGSDESHAAARRVDRRLDSRRMPTTRRPAVIAAVVAVLGAGGVAPAAFAQGAGDDQYQDPFAGGGSSQPATTAKPSTRPATSSRPSASTPSRSSSGSR